MEISRTSAARVPKQSPNAAVECPSSSVDIANAKKATA
jgi:hypothetical protein